LVLAQSLSKLVQDALFGCLLRHFSPIFDSRHDSSDRTIFELGSEVMTLAAVRQPPCASFGSDRCLKMNQKCRVNEHWALKLRSSNLFVTTCHLVRTVMGLLSSAPAPRTGDVADLTPTLERLVTGRRGKRVERQQKMWDR
jgi:hypothetical protein